MMIGKVVQRLDLKKIGIVSVMAVLVLLSFSFAQETMPGEIMLSNGSGENNWGNIINLIISLFSRLWVIFANLAGKFMTNSVVYGSFLHLDAFFIKWWNLIRNFANFGLAFLLIYKILEALIKKQTVELKKTIKKVLITGVLIQASWFLLGALLDVSTILVSSIGTLPAQVITTNEKFERSITEDVSKMLKNRTILIVQSDGTIAHRPDPVVNPNSEDLKHTIDAILPTEQSLAGPLLFLGISVLQIDSSQNIQWNGDRSEFLLDLLFTSAKVILFTIAMLLLFIFSFLRVFVLWIIIPLSPLLILIKIMDIKIGGDKIKPFLTLYNIIKLIFIPVILVLYLSLIMMFLVFVKNIVHGGFGGGERFHDPQSGVTIVESAADQKSSLSVGEQFSLTIDGAKHTFANFLLYIFTFVLLWKLIMMAFATKTGFAMIDGTMKSITDNTQKLLSSVPVVPIPGGGKLSMTGIQEGWNKIDKASIAAINTEQMKQNAKINELLGFEGIEEQARRSVENSNANVFYTNFEQRNNLINNYRKIKGATQFREMPLLHEWFTGHRAPDSGDNIIAGVNLPKEVIINGGRKLTAKILKEWGFDKDGKYIGNNSGANKKKGE